LGGSRGGGSAEAATEAAEVAVEAYEIGRKINPHQLYPLEVQWVKRAFLPTSERD